MSVLSAQRFTQILTQQYQTCRNKLNQEQLRDLDEKIEQLLIDPSPPLTKALQGSLRGKHTVRFAGNPYRPSHRLIITISWNTGTIRFLYLAPRSDVYTPSLQMW